MMFWPAGGVARQLQAGLDRFGARVAEERLHAAVDRDDRRDLLGQAHLRLVVEIGARHVEESPGLIGDRLHDVRMRVAGGVDGDAGRAIEKEVAVHVLHRRSRRAIDDERVAARVGRRDDPGVAFDERLGFGPGQRGSDVGNSHDRENLDHSAQLQLVPTSVSSACRRPSPRAGCRARRGRRESDRRRRSRGGAARRGAPR